MDWKSVQRVLGALSLLESQSQLEEQRRPIVEGRRRPLDPSTAKATPLYLYLKFLRNAVYSFLDPALTPLQRLQMIWHARCFADGWRSDRAAAGRVASEFITSNAYLCVVLNSDMLLLLLYWYVELPTALRSRMCFATCTRAFSSFYSFIEMIRSISFRFSSPAVLIRCVTLGHRSRTGLLGSVQNENAFRMMRCSQRGHENFSFAEAMKRLDILQHHHLVEARRAGELTFPLHRKDYSLDEVRGCIFVVGLFS